MGLVFQFDLHDPHGLIGDVLADMLAPSQTPPNVAGFVLDPLDFARGAGQGRHAAELTTAPSRSRLRNSTEPSLGNSTEPSLRNSTAEPRALASGSRHDTLEGLTISRLKAALPAALLVGLMAVMALAAEDEYF